MGNEREDSRRSSQQRGNKSVRLSAARVPGPPKGGGDTGHTHSSLQALKNPAKQGPHVQTPPATVQPAVTTAKAPSTGRSWASLLTPAQSPQPKPAFAAIPAPSLEHPVAANHAAPALEAPVQLDVAPREGTAVSGPHSDSAAAGGPPEATGSPATAENEATTPKKDGKPPPSPRSFTFVRKDGVQLVKEAPHEESKQVASPAASSTSSTAAEQQSDETRPRQPETAAPALEVVPQAAPSPPLSWAEKARAAAAKPAPPPTKPLRPSPAKSPSSPAPKHQKSPFKQGERGHHQERRGGAGVASPRGGHHSRTPAKERKQSERAESTPPIGQLAAVSLEPSGAEVDREAEESSVVTRPVEEEQQVGDEQSRSPRQPVGEEAPAVAEAKEDEVTIEASLEAEPVANGTAKGTDGGMPSPESSEAAVEALCSPPATFPKSTAVRVQPRGIQNPGNLCFVNAVLQAMLGSTAFCQLMLHLRAALPLLDASTSPVLSALAHLAAEFEEHQPVIQVPSKGAKSGEAKHKATVVLGGKAIGSGLIVDLIHRFSPRQERLSAGDVEQEDAHEFLHFLLDAMHEELLNLRKTRGEPAQASEGEDTGAGAVDAGEDDDDGWLVQSGKRAVRQQEVSASPAEASTVVTSLVEGKLATSVSCAGAPPSVTVHPFKVIGLPISADAVKTISDAIEELTAAETIAGYKPTSDSTPREAAKMERFSHLPNLLVLHLMRFQFTGRSAKVNKFVAFEPKLPIRTAWLAQGSKERGVVYELVATVTHHGKSIGSGHYTADVVQPDGRWLRFDDGNVFWVGYNTVLAERPYLLLYQKISP